MLLLSLTAALKSLGGFVEVVAGTALNRRLKENPDVFLLREHDSSKVLGCGFRVKPISIPVEGDQDSWVRCFFPRPCLHLLQNKEN